MCLRIRAAGRSSNHSASRSTGDRPSEELTEDNPRVQEYLRPQWVRELYQEYTVSTIDDLVAAYRVTCAFPRCGFRGPADLAWPLLTPIEREIDPMFVQQVGLAKYEERVLLEARLKGTSRCWRFLYPFYRFSVQSTLPCGHEDAPCRVSTLPCGHLRYPRGHLRYLRVLKPGGRLGGGAVVLIKVCI